MVAKKVYGQPFGIDVVFEDSLLDEPEPIWLGDRLGFAGIASSKIRVVPIETHLAEKLHAYTTPRLGLNSRVKDLPDIALLARIRELDARRLRTAIAQTFLHRVTHPVPQKFGDPPEVWIDRYARIAQENGLPWPTLIDVTRAARDFFEPVLEALLDATWDPEAWIWRLR